MKTDKDEKVKKDDAKAKKPEKEKVIKVKESEYKKLLDEVQEHKDKYLRILAEFENTRKRLEREKQEFAKYANEGLIVEFLNILDDLERSYQATVSHKETLKEIHQGLEMVIKRIHEMLKSNGVKHIEVTGKKFDPHSQEVMMQEESNEHEEGIVIEEFQKGYMFGEKVIRTAKVKISKTKTAS